MEVTTYSLKKFENLIEIGCLLGRNWCRGHSKPYGNLLPRIFREEFENPLVKGLNPENELYFAEEFKRIAPSLETALPNHDKHLEWLILMQHHSVPTRLLDWSSSILIAAFFAVCSDGDNDGEIWTIYPWELSYLNGFSGLPLIHNRHLQYLAQEPFRTNNMQLAQDLGLSEIPDLPMAFLPPLTNKRITNQYSCFTIHPMLNEKNRIENCLQGAKNITRYLIPREMKPEFFLS